MLNVMYTLVQFIHAKFIFFNLFEVVKCKYPKINNYFYIIDYFFYKDYHVTFITCKTYFRKK